MPKKPIDSKYFKAVFETMNEGVMVVDPEGRILAFNKAAENITGYRSAEVLGKPCTMLDTDTCTIWSEDGKQKRCSVFTNGKVKNKRCQIRNKDGKTVMLLKNAKVLKKDGEIIGAVETMSDITSLYTTELELQSLQMAISHEQDFGGLIGRSPVMENIFEQIGKAAQSDIPVIIYGESGTGKELAAHAIHNMSPRAREPFIKVNCAALSEHLMESELFGHRKGAFTGAIKDNVGRFEAANGGSLFLDEIGDMPPSMQTKLLRVLQEKEFERVGDLKSIKVDVRIITATNRNLNTLMEEEIFREDLYYRINAFAVHMPSLRDHIDDLPLLINHFLKEITTRDQHRIQGLSPEAMSALKSYHWPGNVRELSNVLQYSAITCNDETISSQHLPEHIANRRTHIRSSDIPAKKEALLSLRKSDGKQDQKVEVLEALRVHNFNRTKTAEFLSMSRVGLWKKMKRLGIEV